MNQSVAQVPKVQSPPRGAAAGTAADLAQPLKPIPPGTLCKSVSEHFSVSADSPLLAVVKDGIPVGLVDRVSFLTMYAKPFGRELHERKPIHTVMNTRPLIVDADASLAEVGEAVVAYGQDVLSSGFIIAKDGRYLGVATGIDIVRFSAAAAREAETAARRENAAKSSFLANMSHEIRTPLNSVIGNLELLQLTNVNADQRRLMTNAQISADALLELIGNILNLSKIESDAEAFTIAEHQLCDIIAKAFAIAAAKASQKGLTLALQLAPDVPRTVATDALRLSQVLVNLTGNSLKFTERGGVFVTVDRTTAPDGAPAITFCVYDTGSGFAPEAAARLFEAYKQDTTQGADANRKGTGLGLHICRAIVHGLGGEIGCRSYPGHGSVFTFWLPLRSEAFRIAAPAEYDPAGVGILEFKAINDEALAAISAADGHPLIVICPGVLEETRLRCYAAGATHLVAIRDDRAIAAILETTNLSAALHAEHAPAWSPPRTVRALVVDDIAENRTILAAQLHHLGVECTLAEHGQDALEKLAASGVDVIFSDGSMPVMDGFTFAKTFRTLEISGARQRTPIIAVSAHALAEDEGRFLAAGMDGYISKPVTLAKLADSLRKWVIADTQVAAPAAVPVVDQASLDDMRAYLKPDKFIEIVESSLKTLGEFADTLGAQLDGEALVDMRVTAHSMKGLARQMGAEQLAETVEHIEKRTGSAAEAKTYMPELRRRLSEAQSALAAVVRA